MLERLTKKFADTVHPTHKVAFYYDLDLKGFSLKVFPSGEKRWCVEYRPGAGGRRSIKRRIVLGSTTAVTAEEARSSARKILAAAALGEDPAAARKTAREMPSFREFATRYLEEEATAKLKPRTVVNYRIYVLTHAAPTLGSLKLDKIETSDVARLHRRIGQHKPMTANRVVECISSVYRYAAMCGYVARGVNPASQVKAFRETRRERFLSVEEMSRLGDALREAETTGIPWALIGEGQNSKHAPKHQRTLVDRQAVAALRLLIFTGARLREILNLEWTNVDFERGLLLLPDSKTGRKAIILNAPALSVLSTLPRNGRYVIQGLTPDKFRSDLNRPWRTVIRRAGLNGVRLHDLRHTHASVGAGAGLGLPMLGKLLGHSQPTTTARYAHLDNDPVRRASEVIGQQIAIAMGDLATQSSGKPVQLRKWQQ